MLSLVEGYHNRCLCPQKFPRQETGALLVTEPGQSFTENNADPTSSADESNGSMTTANSNATSMLLASGERVMLQIATVPIQSLDGSVTITARVLLDSASQRTFMTDRLVRELKLVSKYKELLSVSTFGAEKASNVEAIINTRPLTYVYGDFLSGFTLTPAHFLTANLDTVIPFNVDNCEDVDYQQKRDSAQELTEYWRKSQKQLN